MKRILDYLRRRGSMFIIAAPLTWAVMWLLIQANWFKSNDWLAIITCTLILAGWYLIADWWYDGKINGVWSSKAAKDAYDRHKEKQK